MTNRITQKHLEELVALSNTYDTNNPLDINYSSCYGGYQLTYNNGSSILMHRKNAKETLAFLEGIHAGRYLRSRQMMGEVA